MRISLAKELKNPFWYIVFVLIVLQISAILYIQHSPMYGILPTKNISNIEELYEPPSEDFYLDTPDEITKAYQEAILEDIPEVESLSSFEQRSALRQWSREQIDRASVPQSAEGPFELLSQAKSDDLLGACGAFSEIYFYALRSFDIPSRFIQLLESEGPETHLTLEVWSEEHQKWYISDATFNGYLVEEGQSEPLNAYDLKTLVSEKCGEECSSEIVGITSVYDGSSTEPTFENYKIDPILLYDTIYIGENYPVFFFTKSFFGKYLMVFTNRYQGTYIQYYLVDSEHPPISKEYFDFYLNYIGPGLIILFFAVSIRSRRKLKSKA